MNAILPDGFVDSGWDNFDNNYDGFVDDFFEWEPEQWVGDELNLIVPGRNGRRPISSRAPVGVLAARNISSASMRRKPIRPRLLESGYQLLSGISKPDSDSGLRMEGPRKNFSAP